MLRMPNSWKKTSSAGRISWVAPTVIVVIIALTWTGFAQETGQKQKVFVSPQEAMQALSGALRAGDKQSLLTILGPESDEILSSGDPVSDKADRDRFLAACDDKVDFAPKEANQVEVILGHDNWPFPIPLVKGQQGWTFDTAAGKEEILNRRIGRNELDAIRVCEGYVDAQREYASVDREQDEIIQYAQKIISDPDRRNGLYWEPAEGEPPSPAGPFMAQRRHGGV